MSRTSNCEGTQEQFVIACSDMRRASACVSFSMPGPARTTRPPHAKALNSSCACAILLRQHFLAMLYRIDGNLVGGKCISRIWHVDTA